MKKYKKCKGINKANDFTGCGEEVLAQTRTAGLCSDCYYKFSLLNTDKGIDKIRLAIQKVQKPKLELEKAKEESKRNKSLSYLLESVKTICHKFIRLRDRGKPCISCGQPWHSDFDAGHFYPAGSFSSLKFDETNISGQCIGCNRFNEGNEANYRIGLLNRYSKGYLDLLDSKAMLDKKIKHKWDRQSLEEIREYYKTKIKTW
jgi:hypothetical protein